MKAHLIRIGNSRGIRIPKALIEQTGLKDEVELTVQGQRLIIRAAEDPRAGWAMAFQAMARPGDDRPLEPFGSFANRWDLEEWEWE